MLSARSRRRSWRLLIGFGTGGEFDITPYLLSRYFGLRALSTLYGLTGQRGVAGAIGPILMARDSTPAGRLGARHLCDRHLAVGALMLALPRTAGGDCRRRLKLVRTARQRPKSERSRWSGGPRSGRRDR